MRIKVDFSEFFDDERKLSVVNVNTEESITVHDVLEKIVRLFKLTTSRRRSKRGVLGDDKPEYGLFEEGFYIPPEETSTVLQEIGILKLKSLSDAKVETPEKKKKHKKKKAENEIEPRKTRKSRIEDEDPTRSDSEKEETIEKKRNKKSKSEEVECSRKRKNHKRENSEDSEAEEEENTDKVDSLKKARRLTRQKLMGSDQNSGDEEIKVEEFKKQKKRKQQFVESNESGSEGPHEEDKTSKKIKRQKSTKQAVNEETERIQSENQQSVESSEVTATSSSKNHKKESCLDMSVTSTDEIESNALRASKRRKKDKVTECEVVLETSTKCSGGGAINKKLSKSSVGSTFKEDEKLSQEKEVSTSNFGYVECEEAAEKSITSENHSAESSDSDPVFSAIDDGYKPGPKSKRRRRHAKRKKKSVPMEANEEACGSNAIPHSSSYNFSPMNVSHKSNVSTTSANKHVIFGSDNEEEVSCHSNSCDGNDIEIVGQITRPSGKSFLNPLHSETQGVIDVEGEDNIYRERVDASELDITADDLRRMYSQRIGPSLEALSNIRRMCEQNTLTVVRVTSKTESVTTQTFRLPDGQAQTVSRGPPSSFPQHFEVNDNIRKTFRNLLSLQDYREPLILKPPRETNVFLDEVDVEEEDLQPNTPEVIGSSGYPSPVQASPEDSDVEPDMLFLSGQSDLKDSECTPIDDKPGPSTRSSKKDAPRPYHALGKLLMNLRNPGCSKDNEENLQTVSSPEEVKEASHQPVIEILEDASIHPKVDNNTSSALTDAKNSGLLIPGKLNDEEGVGEAEDSSKNASKSNLHEKEEEDLPRDLTEELADLLEEVKDGDSNKDVMFSKYPIMRSLPRVGEFLAIKTLILDENLCPVHSNYMKVQVLEVNGLVVKMKSIQNAKKKEESVASITDEDGVEEVDLTFEEEVDLTEDEQGQISELDWRDIVEPRLLFP